MSHGSNGFQPQVNNQPGVAAEGDFGDANIRATVIAGSGMFVATGAVPGFVNVGKFAWGDQATGFASSTYQGSATAKIGFVHRRSSLALIVNFLAPEVMSLQPGQSPTLFEKGSFWTRNTGSDAVIGQKAFANFADGSVYFAAHGTSTQVASVTGSIAVSTGILTVTFVGSGTLSPGDVLSGVNVPPGTAIVSQLTGTIGGLGTYQTTTTLAAASATITAAASVETDFFADIAALSGTLCKISTWG